MMEMTDETITDKTKTVKLKVTSLTVPLHLQVTLKVSVTH